jgi:hypothetical protein
VKVAMLVGDGIEVSVGAEVEVAVGVLVAVSVEVDVGEAVSVEVGVAEAVSVEVGIGVWVSVGLGSNVKVGVGSSRAASAPQWIPVATRANINMTRATDSWGRWIPGSTGRILAQNAPILARWAEWARDPCGQHCAPARALL